VPRDVRMADLDDPLHVRGRVRIMAISAGDACLIVGR
jgi:hypothetical protein